MEDQATYNVAKFTSSPMFEGIVPDKSILERLKTVNLGKSPKAGT